MPGAVVLTRDLSGCDQAVEPRDANWRHGACYSLRAAVSGAGEPRRQHSQRNLNIGLRADAWRRPVLVQNNQKWPRSFRRRGQGVGRARYTGGRLRAVP